MKKLYNTALAAALLSGMLAYAQDTRQVTLEEAVQMGLKNSKNLRIDAAKIQEAEASLLSAQDGRLPDFKISGEALWLPTAAKVDLKALPSGGGGVNPSSAMFGQASLSLPIYAGGRIRYGIQSATYLVEASKLSAENDKAAIAYNISQAYNNLFKASQTIKVLKENLTAAQKRDQTFLRLENNGVIARNDRLKANLQTSNTELQLLDAENNYHIAIINMDLLLGLPTSTEIAVDPTYINTKADDKPVDFYLNSSVENRQDVKALDLQRKAAALGTKSAKAEYLPTVALTAGYVAAYVPKVVSVVNATNVGVAVSYNLANIWKKNTSYIQSQAREQELEANNELLNDNIKLEVNRDYQNAIFAERKIAVYQKAAEQANENYRINKNKYDNGLATITELLDADAAQVAANVNVINAQADAALAYRKLLQTSGLLTANQQ